MKEDNKRNELNADVKKPACKEATFSHFKFFFFFFFKSKIVLQYGSCAAFGH